MKENKDLYYNEIKEEVLKTESYIRVKTIQLNNII